ncbi:hypothetical protein JCGZ_16265 [Jatropha curcas]|uniref:BHLH domain-containing protein n=1 Tax=Jatropha curcas TaxID=180498 RepID=A0A067L7N6_JATCU|nr:hypothetical protein JCGZ_16265 [Jatropha curcas]
MLCFGDYYDCHQNKEKGGVNNNSNVITTPQKSGVTCSDSSSASSATATTPTPTPTPTTTTASKSNKNRRRNGSGQEQVQCTTTITKTGLTSQRSSKKAKTENPISTSHPKVRREKLGERITALQQLVSPFGKEGEENGEGTSSRKDLRSRGLCLVPIESTVHVASSNGADYWSPAMGKQLI